MQEKERRKVRRDMYYVNGNTVRKTAYSAAPQEVPYEKPAKKSGRKLSEKEKEKRRKNAAANKKKREKLAKKAEKSLAFDLGYTILLIVASAAIFASCAYMITLEAKIKGQQAHISQQEAELERLNDRNSAYNDSIESKYTLDEIYDIAVNELGMVYSSKGQIIYYESSNEDYVTQYDDVPESK